MDESYIMFYQLSNGSEFVLCAVPFLALSAAQTSQMILHASIPVSRKLSLPLRDLLYKLLDRNLASRVTITGEHNCFLKSSSRIS
jgi:hypothetical protein